MRPTALKGISIRGPCPRKCFGQQRVFIWRMWEIKWTEIQSKNYNPKKRKKKEKKSVAAQEIR